MNSYIMDVMHEGVYAYLRPLRNVKDGVGPALHAAVDLLRGHLRDFGQPALQQHRRQVSAHTLCEFCTKSLLLTVWADAACYSVL